MTDRLDLNWGSVCVYGRNRAGNASYHRYGEMTMPVSFEFATFDWGGICCWLTATDHSGFLWLDHAPEEPEGARGF